MIYFSVVDVDCIIRIIMRPIMIITGDDIDMVITKSNNVPDITESYLVDILSFMHLFYLSSDEIKTPAPGSSLKYFSHFLSNSEFPSVVTLYLLL